MARQALKQVPMHEQRWLKQSLLHPSRFGILSRQRSSTLDAVLNRQQQPQFDLLLQQRMKGQPLQYLIGSVEFCGLTLRSRAPTLIPRSETEQMAWWLLDRLQTQQSSKLKILDLCTGSGNIALSLAAHLPGSRVTGVDNSVSALELAIENQRLVGVTNCSFVQCDLLAADATEKLLSNVGQVDLIVANAPYVESHLWRTLQPEIRDWEDPFALVASDRGLQFFAAFSKMSNALLRKSSDVHGATNPNENGLSDAQQTLLRQSCPEPGFFRRLNNAAIPMNAVTPSAVSIPKLVFEFGAAWQGRPISTFLRKSGYRGILQFQDLASKPRWISAFA